MAPPETFEAQVRREISVKRPSKLRRQFSRPWDGTLHR
ncbi:hypothetical protein COLO4_16094 [Corchorus olitorius]|uniref:Uncharacterized protein n=1 Tax=Corchorus olitorius TaxID=93759 RepID=A0A1R3JJR9_9ROSI|nr:hypothetical protein COLO4_16094 [Corchorus olitorius]